MVAKGKAFYIGPSFRTAQSHSGIAQAFETRMNQPPITVQMVPELDSGGVEQCVVSMNRALVNAGYRNLVVSGGGRMVPQIVDEGGEHIEAAIWAKRPSTLSSVLRIRKLILQQRPAILHAHSRLPAWVALLALKLVPRSDRPTFVTTIHGLHRPSSYSRVMVRSDFVIAVSDTALDHFQRTYPNDLKPGSYAVVHRGVEPTEFPYGYQSPREWREHWYGEFPQLRDAFVLCLPGRLTRLKGHLDVLGAVRALADQGIEVQTVFAGGEDPRRSGYVRQLRQRVVDLGLQNQVCFTGHRQDIRNILCVSNVVVSASQKPESFGLAVLESIKLGRVTLGYDHGGVAEVMGATYPEGLVKPLDCLALADRIAQAFQGQLNPPAPCDDFSRAKWEQKELQIYERILRQRAGN